MTKRITLTLPNEQMDKLEEMAKESNISLAEVLRRSLGVFNALQDQKKQGFTEIILKSPGSNREKQLLMTGT